MKYKIKKCILSLTVLILSLFANISIKIFPFKFIIGRITNTDDIIDSKIDPRKKYLLGKVIEAIESAERKAFWRVKCLEQAIIVLIFANILKIDVNLYFGMRRDETNQLLAHAWTVTDKYLISGGEGSEHFSVVYNRTYQAK